MSHEPPVTAPIAAPSLLANGLAWIGGWQTWRDQSVHRRVASAVMTVGALTVFVKVASALKELVVAYQFGTSNSLDSFLMALLLPQFGVTLIGGSLNAALIPTYIRVREKEGQLAAQQLFSGVMLWSTGLLLGLALLLAVLAPMTLRLISPGFSPEKLALTNSLYLWLLPMLVCAGLATTWGAVLNAHDRYSLAAVVPITTSLVTILAVWAMAQQLDATALAVGTVGGAALEVALLGWGLKQLGVSLMPQWSCSTAALRDVWAQYAPMVAGAFLMGSVTAVSQSMATLLDPGSVSTLSYGNKLPNLLFGIGALAVSTPVLPHFSRVAASGAWSELRTTLLVYARILLAITVPITALLIVYSDAIVAFFFQRGAFTETDTLAVGRVQALALLQIPPYIVGMLAVRAISALRANRILMWGAALNLLVNVVCSYVFMRWWQVNGLALASSIMYLVSCLYLWIASLALIRARLQNYPRPAVH